MTPQVPLGVWESANDRADSWERACLEAEGLLRDAAAGWEPGPGPFTVDLPVVNRIINYLAAISSEKEGPA